MSAPPSGKGALIERKAQLVEYLAQGCKPEHSWRIGTEHEKFGFTHDDLRPLPYEGERGIRALLEGLAVRFGWAPVLWALHGPKMEVSAHSIATAFAAWLLVPVLASSEAWRFERR